MQILTFQHQTTNKKSKVSPNRQGVDVWIAFILIVDSVYFQAKSKHIANDFRTDEVEKFKAENTKSYWIIS